MKEEESGVHILCTSTCTHAFTRACLIGAVFTRSQVRSMGDCRWLLLVDAVVVAGFVAEAEEGLLSCGGQEEEGTARGEEAAAMLAEMASYLVMACVAQV